MKKNAVLAVIALSLFASCKERQEELSVPQGILEGIVKDEFGDVLDSVKCTVTSASSEFSTTTGADGKFRSPKLTTGKYVVMLSKAKYITASEEVEIKPEPTIAEFILSSGTSFLRVSDSTLSVTHTAGDQDILVESNANWTVESNSSWLKTSNGAGAGTKTLKLSWEKSTEDHARTAVISIKAGSIVYKISVTQSPPLKLLSIEGVIGNYENGVSDSVKLQFNQPIALNSITKHYEFCVPPTTPYKIWGNRLSFSYPCAALGGEYSFTVSVKNEMNESFSFPVTIQFYQKKLSLDGYVIDYFIANDNQTIWAVTNFPDRILEISVESMTVLNSFNLDFKPQRIVLNQYYNLINVFSHSDWCYTCNSNYIRFFDPVNGSITKLKVDPVDGYDHPNYPSIFPLNFTTMKNGLSVLISADDSGNHKWRFVDAVRDTMYISPSHSSIRYQEIYLYHDQSKILMMHPWGSTTVDILEVGDMNIRTYNSPLRGRSNMLLPNKKANRVLHGQLYEQFISDLEGYVSNVSYIDTRSFYGGTDFSYRSGEEETIYNLADGTLMILDYKIAFTSLSTDALSRMRNLQSTTDGKSVLAFVQNNVGTTSFFRFSIDDIMKNKLPSPVSEGRVARSGPTTKSVWTKN